MNRNKIQMHKFAHSYTVTLSAPGAFNCFRNFFIRVFQNLSLMLKLELAPSDF